MSKFNVGDRVRLTGYSFHGNNVDGFKATVLGVDAEGDLEVRLDGRTYTEFVKPGQCRKFVKRRRSRIWVDMAEGYISHGYQPGYTEFIQVRRKK